MSYHQHPENQSAELTEGQLAVCCPACSRQFALNPGYLSADNAVSQLAKQIAELSDHKVSSFESNFHCSACDFTFSSSIRNKDTSRAQTMPDTLAEAEDEVQQLSFSFGQQNKSEQYPTGQNLSINQITAAESLSEPITESETELPEEKDLPAITSETDPVSSADTQTIEQDLVEEINSDFAEDKPFSVETTDWGWHNNKTVRNFSQAKEEPEEIDYSQFAVDNYNKVDNYNEADKLRDDGLADQGVRSHNMADQVSDEALTSRTIHQPFPGYEQLGYKQTAPAKPKSPFSTLLLLGTPIVLTLALLVYLTYHLDNNLKSADFVLQNLFPSITREPPTGVFIQDPRLRPLVLDSGDIVNVIEGKLVNQSDKMLKAVTIEGLGFSDSGQVNRKERIMLGNPVSLKTVKLKSLNPSNIKELQNKEVTHLFKLRPKSKQDFMLVFTEPVSPNILQLSAKSISSNDMSSFAIRVYGVRW